MWTKSQKLSAGLLGIAVIAFSVDRWVLTAPAGVNVAAASEYAISAASRALDLASPVQTASAATTATTQATTLASRLSALAVTRRYQYVATADAFRASDDWLDQAARKNAAVGTAAATGDTSTPEPTFRKADPAARFAARHALSAVMHSQSGGMAIVDGKLYEIGRVIDGFKLVAVGVKEATFADEDTTVTLKLRGQNPLSSNE
jgi:hypothetical protein